jgi:hypothetical protein
LRKERKKIKKPGALPKDHPTGRVSLSLAFFQRCLQKRVPLSGGICITCMHHTYFFFLNQLIIGAPHGTTRQEKRVW